jgi:hypothetical protein
MSSASLTERQHSFMSRLVPAQAKAIAHLHISDNLHFYLSKAAVAKLKGLEHVEVQFVARIEGDSYYDLLAEMEMFRDGGGVECLKDVSLKSVHFTTFAVGDAPTASVKASILRWMKIAEDEIMGH